MPVEHLLVLILYEQYWPPAIIVMQSARLWLAQDERPLQGVMRRSFFKQSLTAYPTMRCEKR